MNINETMTSIFLGMGLLADFLILGISIYALFQKKDKGLFFWGTWTFFVPLGFALGLYLGITIIRDINETLGLLFMGFALGLVEWFIIRRFLNNSSHWILATVIGWSGAVSLTQYESHIVVYLCGVFLGAAQFLVIAEQYSKSAWWIVATMLGIACFFLQVDGLWGPFLDFNWKVFGVIGLSTLIYSAITGAMFIWITRADSQNTTVLNSMIKSSLSDNDVAK